MKDARVWGFKAGIGAHETTASMVGFHVKFGGGCCRGKGFRGQTLSRTLGHVQLFELLEASGPWAKFRGSNASLDPSTHRQKNCSATYPHRICSET